MDNDPEETDNPEEAWWLGLRAARDAQFGRLPTAGEAPHWLEGFYAGCQEVLWRDFELLLFFHLLARRELCENIAEAML